jgi:hypothetical protein
MSITHQQEAVMSNTIPAQHPAVVLRSHYQHLRSLLAVALVALVGLSATVVMLAVDDQTATTATTIHPPTAGLGDPLQTRTQPTRQTGGVDESAVAAAIASKPPVSGPDESKIAAAIGSQPTSVSAPDESKIAAAIGSHSETGPAARARAYEKAISEMTPKQLAAAYGTEK